MADNCRSIHICDGEIGGKDCASTFGRSEVNVTQLQIGDLLDLRRHQPSVLFGGYFKLEQLFPPSEVMHQRENKSR